MLMSDFVTSDGRLQRSLPTLKEPGTVFMADGIHFQPAGLVLVTERVVTFIQQQGLLEEATE